MILTYKIRHEQNFERELALAKKVAEYGLSTKSITSKDVKNIMLREIDEFRAYFTNINFSSSVGGSQYFT